MRDPASELLLIVKERNVPVSIGVNFSDESESDQADFVRFHSAISPLMLLLFPKRQPPHFRSGQFVFPRSSGLRSPASSLFSSAGMTLRMLRK